MPNQTYRVCFCFRRRFRLAAAEAPAGIKDIFEEYAENGAMNTDMLRRFLVEIQGEQNATLEDAQGIVDRLNHLNIFQPRGLNLETFFKYLLGNVNRPIDHKRGIHQDMTAPLSHYYIYTSHNTYLTGNQLSSDCSDIPIIRALQRGVRGIELDLWPNSTRDDVDVLHGRTLTTPVKLIKCLRSIKQHAFSASEYPVIITLDDHLTADLQALVAEMITQTFGEMLFTPGSRLLREFPSPESLKRRIIMSTKPPKEYLEAKKIEVEESNKEKGRNSTDEEAQRREDGEGVDSDDDDDDEEDLKLQKKAALAYRNLIAIPAGKEKGGMQAWLKVDPNKARRLSLSEQELEKAVLEYGKDIVRFTQHNLLRVYPKGIRLDSSNYNPLSAWIHGAQMVALNMQGYGKSLWLMHGMFRANGWCGYIKKPDFLLNSASSTEIFDPKADDLPVKTTLRVTVYMGQGWYHDFSHTHFDSYSPPDFVAKIRIVGVPDDTKKKKTNARGDNWIPTRDESFEFPLRVPELALLRIEVGEYSDFAGQTCFPVWELRQGIQAVPLYNREGVKYKFVKLLMRFEFV